MNKKEEQVKTKEISFSLDKDIITLPELLETGNSADDIKDLFDKLQKEGYGQYIIGSKGRGKCAKFIPNEKCPKSYTLIVKVKRVYTKKQDIIKTEANQTQILSSYEKNLPDEVKNFKPDLSSAKKHKGCGVICSVNKNYIIKSNVQEYGYSSIEEALNKIWSSVKDYISFVPNKITSQKQFVISNLKGFGYYKLSDTKNSKKIEQLITDKEKDIQDELDN